MKEFHRKKDSRTEADANGTEDQNMLRIDNGQDKKEHISKPC